MKLALLMSELKLFYYSKIKRRFIFINVVFLFKDLLIIYLISKSFNLIINEKI